MRSGRLPFRFLMLLTLLLMLPGAVFAQGNAQLIGYAVLPAGTVTDGSPAGQALSGVVNGLSLPFASQPLGSVTGVVQGDYPGVWLVLTSGTFRDDPSKSNDFQLRIYTVQTDFRTANGGTGSANPVDWLALSDPKKFLQSIAQANTRTRTLTGADLTPRAFVRLPDGSFWVADALGNQLLHFDRQGKLTAAPVPVGGAVAGLSMTPTGDHLIVALGNGQFRGADPNSGEMLSTFGTYPLSGTTIGGISMISDSEALVIEIDGRDGASGFKHVYLADINSGNKNDLVDLLNIDDSNGLSGIGSPFTFPYAAINGIARMSDNSILVVNNNRVPYGEGRQPGTADSTEYIQVQVGQSLAR